MSYYGHTAQAPDFSFIGQVGRDIGNTVEKYSEAKRQNAVLTANEEQATKAYGTLIEQAKELYKSETGDTDDVRAAAFAKRYFIPKIGTETATEAVNRWHAVDPAFRAGLKIKQEEGYKKTAQNVNANLAGVLPDGAKAAIAEGVMSIDDINKQYGTSLTPDQYDAHAGFGIYNGKDQGMAPAEDVQAAIAPQPISYSKGREIVQNSGLPVDKQTQFNPQLETIANKEIGALATSGETPVGYYTNIQKNALPLTPLAEKVGGAMKDEQNLAFRKAQEARKAKGADTSLLQSLLKDQQFRMKMAQDYGVSGEKAADALYQLTLKRQQLDTDLTNAENYVSTDPSKPAPDPTVIMRQMITVDNEIDRIRNTLPNFDRLRENFVSRPTTLRQPIVEPPPPTQPPAPGAARPGGTRPPLSSFDR